jgi:hypothetical protein
MLMRRLPAAHCCSAARQLLQVCSKLQTVFISLLIDGCCSAACSAWKEVTCMQGSSRQQEQEQEKFLFAVLCRCHAAVMVASSRVASYTQCDAQAIHLTTPTAQCPRAGLLIHTAAGQGGPDPTALRKIIPKNPD